MPRKRATAADYMERHDPEMRIILGELVENAARVANWWTSARLEVADHPDRALRTLADAETHLDIHVRIELSDSLRRIRAAMDRLDRELPDDTGDSEAAPDETG